MPFDLITDIEQLRKLIEEENTVEISKLLDQLHPADIAELMEDLNTEEAKFVFMLLDGELASDVLVEIPEADRKRFCGSLNIKNAERKLFEPPKPAECDDKHHVCELRGVYRPGNDDK